MEKGPAFLNKHILHYEAELAILKYYCFISR